jgi:hypothetical protein
MFVVYFTPDGKVDNCVVLGIVPTMDQVRGMQNEWIYSRVLETSGTVYAEKFTHDVVPEDNGIYTITRDGGFEVRRRHITTLPGILWNSYSVEDKLVGYVGYFRKVASLSETIIEIMPIPQRPIPVAPPMPSPTTVITRNRMRIENRGLLEELEQSSAFRRFQQLAE